MCLAQPACVESLDPQGDSAVVSLGGVRQRVSLALVDGVAVGDYLLVHVGFALNRLDPDAARQTLALFAQTVARLADTPPESS
ncbi:MAG: HypC/HybG/HupF family hydrogenase formation chaperone [Magnetococcus sp. WYHC-3]